MRVYARQGKWIFLFRVVVDVIKSLCEIKVHYQLKRAQGHSISVRINSVIFTWDGPDIRHLDDPEPARPISTGYHITKLHQKRNQAYMVYITL